jgi:hypothetical protein
MKRKEVALASVWEQADLVALLHNGGLPLRSGTKLTWICVSVFDKKGKNTCVKWSFETVATSKSFERTVFMKVRWKNVDDIRYRPPLWSSGQSFWLEIQRSRFDSRLYQIFWEVVGLERGPFSLVSKIEELHERKSSCSGLESREYCRRDSSLWPRFALYRQTLALTSPTSGCRSVGILRSRTQATD